MNGRNQGNRWEMGRGSNWTGVARDLMRNILDIHAPLIHYIGGNHSDLSA
jgi:hypothetical protein